MKRTPLKRTRMKRGAKKSKYATRGRAPESWWRFVKETIPCSAAFAASGLCDLEVPIFRTPCGGVIEADHEGAHGLGRKGKDRDVAAICTQHHRERTDHTGAFGAFKRADMRAFNLWAIERTHRLATIAGVEIPNV